MCATVCSTCNGGRLKKDNLFVRIAGHSIQQIVKKDIIACQKFFQELESKLNEREIQIAHLIIKEIITRLEFLK
jgi:excinuclease ABC subunit A